MMMFLHFAEHYFSFGPWKHISHLLYFLVVCPLIKIINNSELRGIVKLNKNPKYEKKKEGIRL